MGTVVLLKKEKEVGEGKGRKDYDVIGVPLRRWMSGFVGADQRRQDPLCLWGGAGAPHLVMWLAAGTDHQRHVGGRGWISFWVMLGVFTCEEGML